MKRFLAVALCFSLSAVSQELDGLRLFYTPGARVAEDVRTDDDRHPRNSARAARGRISSATGTTRWPVSQTGDTDSVRLIVRPR